MQGPHHRSRQAALWVGALLLCAGAVEGVLWWRAASDADEAAARGGNTLSTRRATEKPAVTTPAAGALRAPAPRRASARVVDVEPLREPEPLEPAEEPVVDEDAAEPPTPNVEEIDLMALLESNGSDDAPAAAAGDAAESSATSTSDADSDTAADADDGATDDTFSFGRGTVTSTTVFRVLPGETVETFLWPWPGSRDHGVAVPSVSCDAQDAVRIDKASQLYLLNDARYRIFCLAPGDYTALASLTIESLSGTAAQPRVVRLDNDLIESAIALAGADDADLPTLPPTLVRNSDHWQFIGVRWADPTSPLVVDNADAVLIDRSRIATRDQGVVVRDSDAFRLQRSLVTGLESAHADCLSVSLGSDVAFDLSNSEFNGCHRAVSVTATGGAVFDAVSIAGNEFHRGAGLGDQCDAVGVSLDGAGADPDAGVQVRDNRFSGWQANTACAGQAGAALQASAATGGLVLEHNVMWDNARGVVLDSGAGTAHLGDNVVVGTGDGLGIRIGTGTARVTLQSNHVVRVAQWLQSERAPMTLACNLIATSGLPSAQVSAETELSPNSYLSAQPGVLSATNGGDQVLSAAATVLGPVCVTATVLSDPTEQCLDHAARDPATVTCGSDHWGAE
ncbi:MAG: right-handed parallel beta-helix repeat-containing protein [Pseudomonadota bacterium]